MDEANGISNFFFNLSSELSVETRSDICAFNICTLTAKVCCALPADIASKGRRKLLVMRLHVASVGQQAVWLHTKV